MRIRACCRWPIILGNIVPRQRLRLQVRASPIRASYGRTFWSNEVVLDAVGGAAVVSLPYPMDGLGVPVQESYAGYIASISATQVCNCPVVVCSLSLPEWF